MDEHDYRGDADPGICEITRFFPAHAARWVPAWQEVEAVEDQA